MDVLAIGPFLVVKPESSSQSQAVSSQQKT
jgi:hypothetical protein